MQYLNILYSISSKYLNKTVEHIYFNIFGLSIFLSIEVQHSFKMSSTSRFVFLAQLSRQRINI